MVLKINQRKEEKVVVIDFVGELDSSSVSYFNLKFDEIKKETGGKYFIFNLEKLEFISSAGWSAIVNESKKIKDEGGEIFLAGLDKSAERIYDLIGIEAIIKKFESVEKAKEAILKK